MGKIRDRCLQRTCSPPAGRPPSPIQHRLRRDRPSGKSFRRYLTTHCPAPRPAPRARVAAPSSTRPTCKLVLRGTLRPRPGRAARLGLLRSWSPAGVDGAEGAGHRPDCWPPTNDLPQALRRRPGAAAARRRAQRRRRGSASRLGPGPRLGREPLGPPTLETRAGMERPGRAVATRPGYRRSVAGLRRRVGAG